MLLKVWLCGVMLHVGDSGMIGVGNIDSLRCLV